MKIGSGPQQPTPSEAQIFLEIAQMPKQQLAGSSPVHPATSGASKIANAILNRVPRASVGRNSIFKIW